MVIVKEHLLTIFWKQDVKLCSFERKWKISFLAVEKKLDYQ